MSQESDSTYWPGEDGYEKAFRTWLKDGSENKTVASYLHEQQTKPDGAGGFLIPQDWIEVFNWQEAGGTIKHVELPESDERRRKREYAEFGLKINRYIPDWVKRYLRLYVRVDYAMLTKPYRNSWIDKDGVVQKVDEYL